MTLQPTESSTEELIVAYQGEPGSFSEQATISFFSSCNTTTTTNEIMETMETMGATKDEVVTKNASIKFHPCATFADMFSALSSGKATRAAVPIENSLAGTIHENLDLLLRHPGFVIVGEFDLPVRHCLLALPNISLSSIESVQSHPMALAQCKTYLNQHSLSSQVAYDTAGSAKLIAKQQLQNVAAIASERAAQIYHLNILAKDIQDETHNYTRFLFLAPKNQQQLTLTKSIPKFAKTSIAFSLINSPGILCRALSVFAVSNIDLSKIESRHIHTVRRALSGDVDSDINAKRWGYVFYVDIMRHADEEPVKAALNHLQQITTFYRLLGTYPAHANHTSS